MQANERQHEERIAREKLKQDPLFLGVDGDGASHHWDSYLFAVCVVENGDATVYRLDETPVDTLAGWCEHVRNKRGWDVGPHCGGSLAGDLAEALR